MAEVYLTVAEIAELLKLNQQTIRNWIDRGELPAVRLGRRRVRVRQSDLDAFIDAGANGSDAPVEEPVEEGSVTAWATFGAAMAEATATLQATNRADLVRALDSLASATRALAEQLGS